jgi:hypothetical protein
MLVVRGLVAAAMAAMVAAAAYGCSAGLNTTDATVRCNQEAQAKTQCFDGPDGSVYAACLSCFEQCGDDCTPQELCPEQYLCPGDNPDGG